MDNLSTSRCFPKKRTALRRTCERTLKINQSKVTEHTYISCVQRQSQYLLSKSVTGVTWKWCKSATKKQKGVDHPLLFIRYVNIYIQSQQSSLPLEIHFIPLWIFARIHYSEVTAVMLWYAKATRAQNGPESKKFEFEFGRDVKAEKDTLFQFEIFRALSGVSLVLFWVMLSVSNMPATSRESDLIRVGDSSSSHCYWLG